VAGNGFGNAPAALSSTTPARPAAGELYGGGGGGATVPTTTPADPAATTPAGPSPLQPASQLAAAPTQFLVSPKAFDGTSLVAVLAAAFGLAGIGMVVLTRRMRKVTQWGA
jgi:hypothetical protein